MTRADLSKDPATVAQMFDDVARRYDITNEILALGQTQAWRKATVRAVEPNPGDRILDIAAGTGTSTEAFRAAGADPIACDFSLGMLEVGKERLPHLPFVAGDALKLPFGDNTFDAVTISFGLRNVVDTIAALTEMLRVTRSGGRLVICEFSQPSHEALRMIYLEYLMKYLPVAATKVASNPEAYVYLAESIREWPAQEELSHLLQRAGWVDVQWRNLTGGIVALHRAVKT